jgi:hypothetical protein
VAGENKLEDGCEKKIIWSWLLLRKRRCVRDLSNKRCETINNFGSWCSVEVLR